MSDRSAARRLQKRIPDLSYQRALGLLARARPLANARRDASPGAPFYDLLVEEAEKLAKGSGE